MERIYKDGRRTKVPYIDRGRMLVYSEEEWQFRFRQMGRQNAVLLFVIVALYFSSIGYINERTSLSSLIILVAIIIIGSITYGIYHLTISRRLGSGRPLPGIYERGVELWSLGSNRGGAFLPFDEIDGAGWRKSMSWEILTLFLRNTRKTVTINPHFYGMDGLTFVDDVVHGRVEMAKPPPRLVVYGPQGGI